jgi:hypothetical protein
MIFPPTGWAALKAHIKTPQVIATERIQPLWKGYGNLWRVCLADDTAIVMKQIRVPAGTGASHARKVRSYQVEMGWYQHWSHKCPNACRVPAYYRHTSQGEEHWLLLEDLDSAGFPLRKRQPSAQDIHLCLQWLAHFHATFMSVVAPELWPIGTYWHLGTRQEEWRQMPSGPLQQAAASLDQRLNQAHLQTLVHGDAKLANFCFGPDQVAAVDFQYVGRGCGIRDVAYLLNSCLPETACAKQIPGYLDAYFATLRSVLPPQWDGAALEAEWRALFPVAWADFYRFELGWGPGDVRDYPYSEAVTRQVLASL